MTDPAISYPAHAVTPRPVEETVILRGEGGQWLHVGTDTARGLWHEGLSVAADRAGPSTCSFTLRRDPRVAWPDLAPFNECIIEIGGMRVWSGRMREAPGQSGTTNTITFTGSGWQSHLDDDLMAYGWVHSRMSEWVDFASAPDKGPLGDLYPRIAYGWTVAHDRGRVVIGVATGQSITGAGNQVAGLMLDVGEHHPGARRCVIEAAVTPGLSSSWQVFVRAHNGPGTTVYTPANPLGPSIAADGVGTSFIGGNFGVPCRYVFVFFHLIGGSYGTTPVAMSGDRLVYIHNMWVGSSTDVLTNGLTASRVIGDVVASGRLPKLSADTSRIEATSFAIPDYWPTGHRSPREMIEPVNAFHDYDLGVDVDRRVYFRAPATRASLEVGAWSGAEFTDASAGSGEDVYNKVIVSATDATGTAVEVVRTAATAVPELVSVVTVPSAIANPSVEANTTGWTLTNVSRVSTGGGARGGSWALKTTASTTGVASIAVTGMAPGVPHRLRLWLRTINESGTGAVTPVGTVTIGGAPPVAIAATGAPILTPSPAAGWVERTAVFVPLEDTGTVVFSVAVGGQVLYIDELSVERLQTNVVDRQGFARAQRLPISAPLTVAAAEVLGDVWLRNHIRTPLKGSITVTGQGGVREALGGAPVHPAHLLVRVGEVMRHTGMADPDTGAWGRDGRIASVSYTGGQATVELDNERHRLEALIARYAALAGQVG